MDNINFSTTTELAAAILAKKVSSLDAVEAYVAQIEARNPALNAVVTGGPSEVVVSGTMEGAGE